MLAEVEITSQCKAPLPFPRSCQDINEPVYYLFKVLYAITYHVGNLQSERNDSEPLCIGPFYGIILRIAKKACSQETYVLVDEYDSNILQLQIMRLTGSEQIVIYHARDKTLLAANTQ